MIALRALFLIAMATVPALAEGGPTDAQREAYVAAITANGCHMTEGEAETQLPAVGLDRDTSALITKALMGEGLAELSEDGSTLSLLTEGCAE